MLRYCRAYPAERLRRFPPLDRWFGEPEAGTRNDVLYLWSDLRVTADPYAGEPAFMAGADQDEKWRAFCSAEMGFAVPPDVVVAMGGDE
jgi:hypothetical protein